MVSKHISSVVYHGLKHDQIFSGIHENNFFLVKNRDVRSVFEVMNVQCTMNLI